MSAVLMCPNGHGWEVSLDDTAWEQSASHVCPVCGTQCTTPSALRSTTRDDLDGESQQINTDRMAEPGALPTIPGYEIIRLLGRGGMGTVYKARHLQLDRLVALKIVSEKCVSSGQLARFRAEAQALARLRHSHIVQIYEVNECDGTPYLCLELLEGGSLDKKLAGTPQPPADAARMVATLARAIEDAHRHGIVHRDLKPSNILLTADGQPKVGDFGMAKRLAVDATQTLSGTIIGTPIYMAPEQASGDPKAIGPRTDVYALGTILFEMLTGRPPFQGPTTLHTLELIRAAEPVSPRRLQPGVPRDLETVCLKCLEKQPARRYATAGEFADELERFLAHKPIRARRAGATERATKWVRRHPAPAALVGVVVLAILALAALGIWSNTRLRRAADRADARSRLARSVVDDMYTRVAEEWLADEPRQDTLRQEFLEKALTLYQNFVRESGGAPDVRRETALAYFRLGQIQGVLSRDTEAEQAFHRAIAMQDALVAEDPGHAGYRQDLANSHNWLGEFLRERGRPLGGAEAAYRQARDLQEGLLAEFPEHAVYRKELARSHYNLAILSMETDRGRAAGEHLARAIELLDRLQRDDPAVPDYRHELARCLINRGVHHKEAGSFRQAREDYQRAIELLQDLSRPGVTGPVRVAHRSDLAVALQNLGNLFCAEGRHAEGRTVLEDAADRLRRLVDDFPTRPAFKKKLANCLNSLATVLAGTGALDRAEANWENARALLEELTREYPAVADHHKLLGMTVGNLGWLRSKHEDWAACRVHFETAVRHLRRSLEPNPINPECRNALRAQYQSLAETLIRLRDHTAAAEAAAALPAVRQDRAQDYYYAGCFLSRCASLAEDDTNVPDRTAREEQVRAYVDRALAMLEDAVRKDPAGLQRLPNEHEVFKPLANRDRFNQLRGELDRAGGR
jgi:tetratricopeptide (TPR) repeat protein